MANETLARRYATAIFSLASDSGVTGRIGTELRLAAQAFSKGSQEYDFFVAPTIDRKVKERVILATFQGKLHDIALHSLLLLVRKRRERILGEVVEEYGKLNR
jgi:F-type H+-transporting ATPase subunit delta